MERATEFEEEHASNSTTPARVIGGAGSKESSASPSSASKQPPNISALVTSALCCLTVAVLVHVLLGVGERRWAEARLEQRETECRRTCRLRIVESIPQNLTFHNATLPMDTFTAWQRVIEGARRELLISAYKSSLRGVHVLTDEQQAQLSIEGDDLYDLLTSRSKSLKMRMVENYPPKDRGDNADGIALEQLGIVNRVQLDLHKAIGSGKFHNKFLVADASAFYVGSANLDWRSINQKMEIGVLVEDCSCLGAEMAEMFDSYYGFGRRKANDVSESSIVAYNAERPLQVKIDDQPADVYIASSPKWLNPPGRVWDRDAIVNAIDDARRFLYIHVMDYFPMYLYTPTQHYWSDIDDAIRRAAFRGVKVKLIASPLHHARLAVGFLKSLTMINNLKSNVSIEARFFLVPSASDAPLVVQRERRTHNKFLVTESVGIIGTSNWVADYFYNTTGAAVVVRQTGKRRTFVNQLEDIFLRDWTSAYVHSVDDYFTGCVQSKSAAFCHPDKHPSLLAE